MKRNKKASIGILLVLLFLFVFGCCQSVSADNLVVSPGMVYICGNENYTVSNTMSFSDKVQNDSWIRFNNTDFNVSSTNPINLTLSYINSNIPAANVGDTVLSFTASTTAGTVWFNLSGFSMFTEYSVFIDDVFSGVVNSFDSDIIHFNYSSWSEHEFDIKKGDLTGTRELQIEYERNSIAGISGDSFNVLSLMILIALVMVAAIILSLITKPGGL